MEKMREEFEAWHIEQCKADGMDWRDLSSELERDGDEYVYAGAHYAWRGWKASRAALCVELPYDETYKVEDDWDVGYFEAVSFYNQQLENLGVTLK